MCTAFYVLFSADHIGVSVAIDTYNDISRVIVGLGSCLFLFGEN